MKGRFDKMLKTFQYRSVTQKGKLQLIELENYHLKQTMLG
jgi:hypothetical protein